MPRLIFAVVCQRAIVSQEGLLTLVDVIEKITFTGIIEPDDTHPRDLTLVTHWRRTPDDEGIAYELRTGIYFPDGKLYAQGIRPAFEIRNPHTSHRYIFHVKDFPIGREGIYTIRVSIRPAGSDSRWKPVASYPVEIEHKPPPSNESPAD